MEIDAHELKKRLEAGDTLEVVDIREEADFASWHIHGSRNLPVYDALRANQPQAKSSLLDGAADLPKDRTLVAVCKGGILSQRAAQVLRDSGREALSLTGGIRGWGGVWTEAPIFLEERPDATLIQIRRNGKGCLSYLLGHGATAIVVDPSVDIDAYQSAAAARGLTITHVLETHVHADHLSRARQLCEATGAQLVMPQNDRVTYAYQALTDGDTLNVGGITVEGVSTPGHTNESMCYLIDGQLLLTGDTLFARNVGRPDLEKGDAGADAGARALFVSLHKRLLARFGDLRFYPAHCGSPIGFDGSPIGNRTGAVQVTLELLQVDEEAFVAQVLGSLTAKPPNFERVIAVNEGRADLGGVDPMDLEAGPNRCAAG